MYRLGIVLAMLFLCVFSARVDAQEHSVMLKNGMRVLVQQDDRFPLVAVRLMVRTGVIHETPGLAGVSHFLEHMVFLSTKSRAKGELSRAVEAAGGNLNAWTYFDRINFEVNMPAQAWKLGMNIVWDETTNALLLPEELEKEREVVIAEIKRAQDEPFRILAEKLRPLNYTGTVYAHPVLGTEESVRGITAEAMRAYYKRWFQPANMLLVVAGKVNPDEVLAEADRLFGGIQNTDSFPGVPPLDLRKVNTGREFVFQSGAWGKIYMGLSFPAPEPSSLEAVQLEALMQLLTGDKAAFFDNRYMFEHHLVDMTTYADMELESGNSMAMYFVLDPEHVSEFWTMVMGDLAHLDAASFTREELDRVKLRMEDDLSRMRETVTDDGLADWLVIRDSKLGGRIGEENRRAAIQRLTLADVQHAIDTWLRPEYMKVACLYPDKVPAPDLASIAEKEWPVVQAGKAAPAPARGAEFEKVDLGAGRTALLLPDASMPYTAVSMTFTGGDALLSPARQGLGELTAAMLTSGAGTMDAQAVERYLAERAASLSASSDLQTFTLSMRQPSRFNKDMFSLLETTLTRPRFDKEELVRSKKEQIADIVQQEERAVGILGLNKMRTLYAGHPYGYRPLGDKATVEGFAPKAVREFWNRQRRQPWIIAVAGDFDREAVLSVLKRLPVPADSAVAVSTPDWGKEKMHEWSLSGRSQAHCLLLFPGVPVLHEDMPALVVLGELLGGGMSSPLFSELREKRGLAYTLFTDNRSLLKSGYFEFYIGTTADKLKEAQDSFYAVLDSYATKAIPPQELERAVNLYRGSYDRGVQTLSARASEAARLAAGNLPRSFFRDLPGRMEKVTSDDIHRVIHRYIAPDKAYVLIVKP